MTVTDVAAYFHVHRITVYRLVAPRATTLVQDGPRLAVQSKRRDGADEEGTSFSARPIAQTKIDYALR